MAETKLAAGSWSAEVPQFLQRPCWPHGVVERQGKRNDSLEKAVRTAIDINEQALAINRLNDELGLERHNVRLLTDDRDKWRREAAALRAVLDTIKREYGIR
jgi:hypothetical protein